MRIVFMGTPDIAATCLTGLLDGGFEVAGVYTKPDRPKGRRQVLTQSEVKQCALAHGLQVFQPATFRDEAVIAQLQALQPDVIAVVAYGKILPKSVLDIPPLGCINIHASILPQLRGSGPVQWAILNGLDETGVTAMFMAEEMDAGDIIEIRKTPIEPYETAQQLLDRLAVIGSKLLQDTLRNVEQGSFTRTVQDESQVTFAPMLTKELCPIDWTKLPRQIIDQVRGLNPWPVATTVLDGRNFKIYQVRDAGKTTDRAPGTPLAVTRDGLDVACGGGHVVTICQLQADGGRQMAAPDYFRGHPIQL